MAMKSDKDRAEDPSTPSPAHCIMAPRIAKMRCVLGGTETMREAGEEYLPRFSMEESDEYESRLAKSYFYNCTDLTIAAWVGKVFAQPLHYANRPGALPDALKTEMNPAYVAPPPLDPRITALFSDIDLEGNSIDVFSRAWFRAGIDGAVAPMLVLKTNPRSPATAAAQRTKLDDQNDALRAYWRMIAPENVLDCRTEERNGREVCIYLRVLGVRVSYEGFLTVHTPIITVYEPRQTQVYRLERIARSKRVEWIAETAVANDFSEIPFVVFYAEKEDVMVGRSPSFDLADINIRHWQSYSAQVNCLEVARFPMLAGAGVPDEQVVVIGNRRFLRSELPEAKFYYVEHGGAALLSGEHDLEMLTDWMSKYGSDFLKKKVSHVTAADSVLSTAEATSSLSDVSCRFNDALATALYHTATLMGMTEPKMGALTVKTDFTDEQMTPTDPSTNKERANAPKAAAKLKRPAK